MSWKKGHAHFERLDLRREERESTVRHRVVSKWPSATSQEQVKYIPSPVNTPRHWTVHHYSPFQWYLGLSCCNYLGSHIFTGGWSRSSGGLRKATRCTPAPPNPWMSSCYGCFPKTRGLTHSNVAREVHHAPFSNEFVNVASRSGGLQWEVICAFYWIWWWF